jgi:CRP/FNR family transcriptional regulator, dissimilatory nitrate respiration regulator
MKGFYMIAEILQKCLLFSGMDDVQIGAMLTCLSARRKEYSGGEYILSAGDKASAVGIVLNGCVQVVKEDIWGSRAIIGIARAGELFGEALPYLENNILPVSVIAAEHTQVLLLDSEKLIANCESACRCHTRLIMNLVGIMAEKNMMLTRKLEHIMKHTTREKLLSYLSEEAAGRELSFDIPLDRQGLADYLSVDRSALSRELGAMRREGILEFNRNRFVIRKELMPKNG